MKSHIPLLFFLVLHVSAFDSNAQRPEVDQDELTETLVGLEKKAWKAIESSDLKTLKTLYTEEFLEVDSTGRRGLQQILQAYSKPRKAFTFALSDIKVIVLGKDSAILTYRGALTPGGQFYASAIFVNEGERWKYAFWQMTPLGEKQNSPRR